MVKPLEIKTLNDWKTLMDTSVHHDVLLMKHSTACPISAKAWKEYQRFIKAKNENLQTAFVKVIESRDISQQIEKDLGVKHESPQVILIQNKNAVSSASHFKINQKTLTKLVT